MVFKRRDKLSRLRQIGQFLWPKTGWSRAAKYLKLRIHRLPDTPQKIARGTAFGVFTVFTPLYGLHFVLAYVLAKLFKGNGIAALLATFVGNPLTYVPIGVISLKMGHFLLGTEFDHENERSFVGKSFDAIDSLWDNLVSIFTGRAAEWDGLVRFFYEIFLPYLVGGLLPGAVAAIAAYYLTLPMIAAYQIRRRKKVQSKLKKAAERTQ